MSHLQKLIREGMHKKIDLEPFNDGEINQQR